MEPLQQQLFTIRNPKSKTVGSDELISSEKDTSEEIAAKPVICDIDHHMLYIVAAYIKKLPDNQTRKQLARLLINTIIKSANL